MSEGWLKNQEAHEEAPGNLKIFNLKSLKEMSSHGELL